METLLYAAALSIAKPSYAVFSSTVETLSVDSAGLLILLGRGFGMSAMQSGPAMFFVRRSGKELDPLCKGAELAAVLEKLDMPEAQSLAGNLKAKDTVVLIGLPFSPDSREHLHELKDAAAALGIKADEGVFAELKSRYVLMREDITPQLIS